jgi:serpin B
MLTRRDTLRLAALSALAVSGLSACGSTPEAGPGTDVDLASSDIARAPGLVGGVPGTVASLQGFAGRLYGQGPADGNLVISPFSVAMALAMTVNGAKGKTRSEMLEVLGVSDLDAFNGGLNALTQELESLAGAVERADGSKAELALDSANSLWGQRDTAWQQAFLDELARDYGTGMRLVDYKTAWEDARAHINDWTAAQTHDKITDLIPEGVLDKYTRLVLVNAIYLKAAWETPFEVNGTELKPFDGGRLIASMMTSYELPASYRHGNGWQSAQLAYAGRSLAMTIVLPDPGRLDDLEAAVASDGMGGFLGGEQALLHVEIPKWTTRSSLGLVDALTALGMPTPFDDRYADFSGMTTQEHLFIKAVLHQGYIAVDEEGTEAAAATAVVAGVDSAPITQPFIVNRPFLYVVHDTAHGTPLFVGRVTDPS